MEKEPLTPEQLDRQLELVRARQAAEFALTPAGQQMQLLKAEQEAKFALTPVGQELQRFQTNQRMGQMYASSTIVPDTYKGNVANCSIAIDIALRMGANALMVMQNLYLVHGMPSWSSKFLIATINTCGRFQPLRYECNNLTGNKYGWRCFTYAADDTEKKERLEGPWVTWETVKAEKWDAKPGSKWATMPEQMFRYRAAAFWQRLYAPEISMGFNTVEESQDIVEDVEYVETAPKAPAAPQRMSISELARKSAIDTADKPKDESDPTPQPLELDTETGELFS